MYIALIFLTINLGDEFYAIEAQIIITLCIGNILADGFVPDSPEMKGKRTKINSAFGILLETCSDFAITIYMI
jgi:uncharacterized hydantoinase/oxoprolinase family protein